MAMSAFACILPHIPQRQPTGQKNGSDWARNAGPIRVELIVGRSIFGVGRPGLSNFLSHLLCIRLVLLAQTMSSAPGVALDFSGTSNAPSTIALLPVLPDPSSLWSSPGPSTLFLLQEARAHIAQLRVLKDHCQTGRIGAHLSFISLCFTTTG